MVAGVTPGKGGTAFEGIPIFDTVSYAVAKTAADATVIYVPPPFAADAIMEAADARIPLIICITEGVPVRDMIRVKRYLEGRNSQLLGPNVEDHSRSIRWHHARPYSPLELSVFRGAAR
jgi:succinyl-CoA synthetase alpha subunit